MMKYAVFGGCGFIGACLTDRLSRNPENIVTVIDIACRPHIDGNVRYINARFEESTDFLSIVRGQDIVLHGISTTSPRNFHGMRAEFSENLMPTIQLLEACITGGVKKVLFLSSGGTVYGESPDKVPLYEECACKPICAYGMQKYAIEMLLDVYKKQYGLSYITARIGNPYGPRQYTNGVGVISTFTRLLKQGEKIALIDGGRAIRDYIYIDDLADALLLLMQYDGPFSTFNVSSGIGHSVSEILKIVADFLGVVPQIDCLPNPLSDVSYNVLDISRIRRETGFCPRISLPQGIRMLVKDSD